jgi:hypothetical protein
LRVQRRDQLVANQVEVRSGVADGLVGEAGVKAAEDFPVLALQQPQCAGTVDRPRDVP